MKTKEELNALKEEVETVNRKLHELTEEELAQVTGGTGYDIFFDSGIVQEIPCEQGIQIAEDGTTKQQ